ncbi:class I SAM-dependent methyltransferase [Aliirhizobium smilacinae]|uniref:Class I SAM-dependent methyltransferase n=1 Tax=Aliirhizobium smilacinae TaxID=1395944 RepID=A0A5C4XHV4_9HYPH|nr:class I SAM-dependent methyltransferase [Rhizobium smilacinae]TNM62749.1 class I SAM-dependent methyltransferase [Rhizobium smilacinae]
MNGDIRKFIFKDLQTVEGYIDPPDALVFLALLQAQNTHGLSGGVAEIGVFYGRSYFLYRKVCGDKEKILAIDLFDIDQSGGETVTQYDRFIENGERLGLPVDQDLVICGDSTQLRPTDITEKIGTTRFFSIDGGHMLHHVTSDSVLALDALAPHGIIAFDDTFNPAWPEVTVGVTDFLRERQDELATLCMTKYKTYVCRKEFHDFYCRVIDEAPDLMAFDHIKTDFLGSKAIRLHNPMARRMVYEMMVRSGMRSLSERVYR